MNEESVKINQIKKEKHRNIYANFLIFACAFLYASSMDIAQL